MPSHVPRSDSTKKREQLTRRQQELQRAIHEKSPRDQILSAVEAVRAAHLSLLKDELHWAEQARVKGEDVHERIRNIHLESQRWKDRASDAIVNDVAATQQIARAGS
jgi:hypothetical protein